VSIAASRSGVPSDRLSRLARALGERLVTPDDPRYETGRSVWNAAVDRRPAAIIRAAGSDDVIRAIAFARETGVDIAVRGGGHSMAGHGTVDDGVLLDMSGLQGLRIDPTRRVARVEAGVLAGTYTEAAAAHGLVTPFGDTATVGIAGLALGGGVGWLSRKLGLTIDSVRALELVTADGDRVTAGPSEHPDLFWALRGGGGNFGVVTALELDLHPLGPIYGGVLFLPLTRDVVRGFAEVAAAAADELTTIAAAMRLPPAPFVPADLVGTPALAIMPVHADAAERGEAAMATLRSLGTPLVDLLGPMPFPAMYGLTAEGSRRQAGVTRSHSLSRLDAATIDAIVEMLPAAPADGMAMIQLRILGGAVGRVPADATAYAHRDAEAIVAVIAGAEDALALDAPAAWVREVADSIAPRAPRAYVNFLEDEGDDRVRAAYGEATHHRLVEVKRRWDPGNLFRMNQNIRP
jgi:FAD/FMN-containing dehydrogenase